MAKKSVSAKKSATSKKVAKKKTIAKKSPTKVAKKKVASKKKTASASKKAETSKTTAVHVQLDVGFGNSLFIRGEGAGLSWDEGELLSCIGSDKWTWESQSAQSAIVFKILINDEIWSAGENFEILPGENISITPHF